MVAIAQRLRRLPVEQDIRVRFPLATPKDMIHIFDSHGGRNEGLRENNTHLILTAGMQALNSPQVRDEIFPQQTIAELVTVGGIIIHNAKLKIAIVEMDAGISLTDERCLFLAQFVIGKKTYGSPSEAVFEIAQETYHYRGSGFGSGLVSIGGIFTKIFIQSVAVKNKNLENIYVIIKDDARGGSQGNKGWSTSKAKKFGMGYNPALNLKLHVPLRYLIKKAK